ncbi:sensor histidine kinase [Streptomyces sp. NPDC047123]|uniref:sensor histidine kinase n=1 Tax=Streptomyces sp. NPDC047123 TaxID=3155622 RepID=UPI0033EA6CF1
MTKSRTRRVRGRAGHWPAQLRADLLRAPRLPAVSESRTGPFRWLSDALVAAVVVVLAGAVGLTLWSAYGLPLAFAAVLGPAHASSVMVAARRPVLGFWQSMAVSVLIALVVYPPGPNSAWPWPYACQLVHMCVLFLVALRSRPRVTAETLLLSIALTAVMRLVGGGDGNGESTALSMNGFAIAAGVALYFHTRRQAQQQLDLQKQRTAEEHERNVLLEERARIARELHDVVAHHMSMIAIQADAAPLRAPDVPAPVVESLGSIRAGALEALAELRRVLGVLRSPETGVPERDAPQPDLAALDSLVDGVRRTGTEVGLRVEGTRRALPAGVELSAYRIVQEALSNAVRHAPGTAVDVTVTYGPRTLTVDVHNADPVRVSDPSSGSGHGMRGMRERVTMLGGELSAGRDPQGGWRVRALLPVPEEGEALR